MLFAGLLRIRIELRTILIIHYLLIFTILATWICNIIFTMQEEVPIEKLYMLGGITIFVLIIGLAVSAVFAKKITSPLTVLTTLAEEAAGGDYSSVKLLHRFLKRHDEIGVLAKVFNNMIQAVEKRETAYKQEVSELRIKIDHKKQKEELNKITGTNYFQNLKLKAGDLRRKASNKEEDQ
jgi:methyl-accepting chemotaxis protein